MGDQAELVFDALGEPVRRRIVELLKHGPRSVGGLAQQLPVGRPAVSKHLKVLTDARLTDHRSVGTSNLYSLRPEGMEAARRWLTEAWDTVLAAYADAAREQARDRREAQHGQGGRRD
jgi:DNA-binding transcriptional ArsR family regulator